MAASMWRMNGLWRRMAAALLICALLLSNNVMCQDDLSPDDSTATTQPKDTTNNAVASGDGVSTVNPAAAASVPAGDGTAASNASGDNLGTVTTAMPNNPANQDGDTSGTPVTTPALGDIDEVVETKPTEAPLKLVVPTIKCVNEEDIKENNAVTAEVATADCEATKSVMEDNPAPWCRTDECNLSVFQEGAKMMVASENAPLADVERVLKGDILKEKLGVTSTKVPSSSGPSVFVGILVPGLLAAIAIIVGYFKFQRKSGDKGARLAEEAYPDQENQGNTLVSVAPLNPPPETVEKPSVNGESPEAAKTQPPPPTNGHSTAKTADTEL